MLFVCVSVCVISRISLSRSSDCCLFIGCSLVRPANLDQLVNYVLQTPPDDENEKAKYKSVLCSLTMLHKSSCIKRQFWDLKCMMPLCAELLNAFILAAVAQRLT